MFGFKEIFGNFLASIKKLSKKAYTSGLIIISGCILTILLIGTFGFAQVNQIDGKKDDYSYEEETIDVEEEAIEVFGDSEDGSQSINLASTESSEISDQDNSQLPQVIKEDVEEVIFTSASNQQLEELDIALMTEKDYEALVRIVEAEATGEDIIGKILVANVVLNRVESSRFPDSIYDVVHQNIDGYYQFSPLSDGRYYSVSLTDSTYEAVERALSGEDYSEEALFFVARELASESGVNWFDNNLVKVTEHGVHEFYTY